MRLCFFHLCFCTVVSASVLRFWRSAADGLVSSALTVRDRHRDVSLLEELVFVPIVEETNTQVYSLVPLACASLTDMSPHSVLIRFFVQTSIPPEQYSWAIKIWIFIIRARLVRKHTGIPNQLSYHTIPQNRWRGLLYDSRSFTRSSPCEFHFG